MIGGGIYKIVIIEDGDVDMFIMRRCLEMAGIEAETIEITSFYQAMSYVAALPLADRLPTLIITDMDMRTGGGGLDIINELKANKFLADIPVIAMTNYPIAFISKQVTGQGADYYFIKPPDKEVMDTIKTILLIVNPSVD